MKNEGVKIRIEIKIPKEGIAHKLYFSAQCNKFAKALGCPQHKIRTVFFSLSIQIFTQSWALCLDKSIHSEFLEISGKADQKVSWDLGWRCRYQIPYSNPHQNISIEFVIRPIFDDPNIDRRFCQNHLFHHLHFIQAMNYSEYQLKGRSQDIWRSWLNMHLSNSPFKSWWISRQMERITFWNPCQNISIEFVIRPIFDHPNIERKFHKYHLFYIFATHGCNTAHCINHNAMY